MTLTQCRQCGKAVTILFRKSYIHPVSGKKVVARGRAFAIPFCDCTKK